MFETEEIILEIIEKIGENTNTIKITKEMVKKSAEIINNIINLSNEELKNLINNYDNQYIENWFGTEMNYINEILDEEEINDFCEILFDENEFNNEQKFKGKIIFYEINNLFY